MGTQKQREPLIKLKIGPQQEEVEFLVDSGAERSTIQQLPSGCELSRETALGITWEEHTPWHPQSSGRVERMNGELKKQLSKLILETKLSWVKCIPLALLNIRAQPRADIGISPFEMLYGMPYDAGVPTDHPNISDKTIKDYISELMKYRQRLWEKGLITQRPPLDITLHRVKPGDWVLIKSWREATLQPRWEGPYLVLLTTNTAVRTAEKGWTHASRIKGPVDNNEWTVTSPAGDLKVKLSRKSR